MIFALICPLLILFDGAYCAIVVVVEIREEWQLCS